MSPFNELNAVEQMVIDACRELGWRYVPAKDLQRQTSDVMVESMVREALVRLNPEIAAEPDRADEVLYRLRAIPLSVASDGLVRANETFAAWIRNEKTMPFGERGEHTSVRLIDYDNPAANELVVANQWTFRPPAMSQVEKRFDVVLLVNGLPLVVGEAKTPVRPAVTWVDGATDIRDDYEENVPQMFAANVFSFSTDGRKYRYGTVRMPIEKWGPWHTGGTSEEDSLDAVRQSVSQALRPEALLDLAEHFTVFGTDKKHRKIKIIARYQQYETTNQIVERVVAGRIKRGLIWHFQGSGKSLLMVFAAQKLRLHPELGSPTVLIVVDRVDLDTQITATFNMADVPNMVSTNSRQELTDLLRQDQRKVIITTIHKFAEAEGVLNDRSNIIVMVDEAHRTQEKDLGRRMREALPHAFLFGLTGTPINRADRNTFWAFGATEDEHGYMSRYSFTESLRDKATLPLHFETVEPKLRVDRAAIDEAFEQITNELSEQDRDDLAKRAAKMAVLIKSPERVRAVVGHMADHFQAKVEPNGFKAQVVTFDRQCCHLYWQELRESVGDDACAVVMHSGHGDPEEWRVHRRNKDEEEKLLDRFRDADDPLQFLVVTSKLLTGFDAPVLQVMYLDKPMRDHNLLQAICRTNRPYPDKTHGLIVDYLGIFDDVAQALNFDEKAVQQVITNLDDLKKKLPEMVATCLAYFPNVDRTVGGYEGLIAAQECLRTNEQRDAYAADYSALNRLWEALSPDPCLGPYRDDYRWLAQVYESVKPVSGNGKLLWHALGAKTIELIHENVHLETVRDDLETLVMDADVLESFVESQDPKRKSKEIEIKIIARLRKHRNDPRFTALGERLERLRERHEQGLLTSREFLKQLLELARDVVSAERDVDPVDEQEKAKAALTDLFAEVRNSETPVMVERIVADIDEIVRVVRFPGWQQTSSGEREVKQALRRTLLKYKLHKDQELFDRAYAYIREYY